MTKLTTLTIGGSSLKLSSLKNLIELRILKVTRFCDYDHSQVVSPHKSKRAIIIWRCNEFVSCRGITGGATAGQSHVLQLSNGITESMAGVACY